MTYLLAQLTTAFPFASIFASNRMKSGQMEFLTRLTSYKNCDRDTSDLRVNGITYLQTHIQEDFCDKPESRLG